MATAATVVDALSGILARLEPNLFVGCRTAVSSRRRLADWSDVARVGLTPLVDVDDVTRVITQEMGLLVRPEPSCSRC